MAAFNGPVWLFVGNDGNEYVSLALPYPMSSEQAVCFNASGPYLPLGFPRPTQVPNLAQWLRDRQNEGFSFTQAT